MHLAIEGLSAAYGHAPVLKDIALEVEMGEIMTLIGPSGSGRSSLLRVLIGLLPPRSGNVTIAGEVVNYNVRAKLKALRDRLAIVFQQYNLFQNMTALANVTVAPIRVKGRPTREVEEEAKALLAKVGLSDEFNAYPDQLSGRQKQRVAIARALALRPEILLLDEVTSALDPELVGEVLDSIRLLSEEGMTMLIVSHEMGFVREVSSRTAFMADGRVVELASPSSIFDNPQQPRTRDFVARILRH